MHLKPLIDFFFFLVYLFFVFTFLFLLKSALNFIDSIVAKFM